jgi:hypothetical protein
MTDAIKYDASIYIRAPAGVVAEIKAAARRRDTKPSQFVRDALSLALSIESGGSNAEQK